MKFVKELLERKDVPPERRQEFLNVVELWKDAFDNQEEVIPARRAEDASSPPPI